MYYNTLADFVISLRTLRSFYLVIAPVLEIPIIEEQKNVSTKMITILNNQVLPLAYLDCQDIRVIIPSADLAGSGAAHDVFICQMQKMSLSPSAINPICRNPLRPDIYEQAAHARILSIPGKLYTMHGLFWRLVEKLLKKIIQGVKSVVFYQNENTPVEFFHIEVI